MLVSDFDFELPEELIALRPAEPRDAARLLVSRPGGAIEDRTVSDLPTLLRHGDALVFNDTKVIPAQLTGLRHRGDVAARVEATLIARRADDSWEALLRPAKRVTPGDRIRFGPASGNACLLGALDATVEARGEGGLATLRFDLAGAALDEAVRMVGLPPLPPYIAGRRAREARDAADYQTVYARAEGAVAAPTAGLHFTESLMDRLRAAGVSLHFLTLHVGAGTFLPVKVEAVDEHRMHSEWGSIPAATAAALNMARAVGGRIVAVGTTAARLLESAAAPDGTLAAFEGETAIFIQPGYRFRAIDGLMTNFHLPRSTLFMLVAALIGLERAHALYAHAVTQGYRFYSFGDASLLFPPAQER